MCKPAITIDSVIPPAMVSADDLCCTSTEAGSATPSVGESVICESSPSMPSTPDVALDNTPPKYHIERNAVSPLSQDSGAYELETTCEDQPDFILDETDTVTPSTPTSSSEHSVVSQESQVNPHEPPRGPASPIEAMNSCHPDMLANDGYHICDSGPKALNDSLAFSVPVIGSKSAHSVGNVAAPAADSINLSPLSLHCPAVPDDPSLAPTQTDLDTVCGLSAGDSTQSIPSAEPTPEFPKVSECCDVNS